jgi:putative ABC transport system permease protein
MCWAGSVRGSFAKRYPATNGLRCELAVRLTIGAARGPLPGVSQAITAMMASVSPSAVLQFETMDAVLRRTLVGERLMATLSGFFGGLAALIATIGLYGVMSYIVVKRRTEIGIRMALGADRGTVLRMVITEVGTLLVIGVAFGAVLAGLAGRAATALLCGLTPSDPATLGLAVLGMAVVGVLASWLPARVAARLEPSVAPRSE